MKIILIGVFCLLFSLGVSFGGEKALVVGVDCDSPPFVYKDPATGQIVGFDIDLLTAISKIAGFTYQLQPMPFLEILSSLQAGKIDIGLSGISITDSRKKNIEFSTGYYLTGIGLIVSQKSRIKGVGDLESKKVAVKTGTVSVGFINRNATEVELMLYPDHASMLADLVGERVDVVVCDEPVIDSFLQQGGQGVLKSVGDIYAERSYGIAFPKESKLVHKVDNALNQLRKSGEYEKMYKDWFGSFPSY